MSKEQPFQKNSYFQKNRAASDKPSYRGNSLGMFDQPSIHGREDMWL
ncbi:MULTISPECIES: hypothetical protein [Pectobacterium]|nr:hypothetical protein [Pectobacterium sp. CFBP8739]MBA0168223.1 hypothetical protein [Pectobacterium sp. CFBP8739]